MKKYRKKPLVIEAVQWDGEFKTGRTIQRLSEGKVLMCPGARGEGDTQLLIQTLEGDMYAQIDDWIIKGIKGEFYPCKPDIFEATYEEVDEAAIQGE